MQKQQIQYVNTAYEKEFSRIFSKGGRCLCLQCVILQCWLERKNKGNRLMNTFLIKVSFLNVFLCFAHGQMWYCNITCCKYWFFPAFFKTRLPVLTWILRWYMSLKFPGLDKKERQHNLNTYVRGGCQNFPYIIWFDTLNFTQPYFEITV